MKDKLLFSIFKDGDKIEITPLNEDKKIRIKGRRELKRFIELVTDRSPGLRLSLFSRFLGDALVFVIAYILLSQICTQNE